MTGSFVVSILIGVTAVMAAALTVATLSRRRRAATRHAWLTAAFVVVLVLPVASTIAATITIPVAVPTPTMIAHAVASFDAEAPVAAPVAPTTANLPVGRAPHARWPLAAVLEGAWLLGLVVCLAPIAIGLLEMRSLGGRGLPWRRGRALTDALMASLGLRRRVKVVRHESASGPMTYGTLRPTIVMPIDAEAWSDEDLGRAIVHELEHIRRADWLTQIVARGLCAAYWFHPLVWIARGQLVLEAERASDDAVLAHAEAHAYADQLVDLARRLSAGHRPALAMANRRDLAARVQALLDVRLPRGRAGAWLVAAVSCAAAALVIVLSPMRLVADATRAQSAGTWPKFDVVSVRPCDPKAPPVATGRSMTAGQLSPGHLFLNCRAVNMLIETAYVTFADGRFTAPSAHVRFDVHNAGPEWIRSDKFTIEATAADTTSLGVMEGPMLQSVLEDRFKLKTHRETREVPVLELVVAKGGPKITPLAPGTCVPWEYGGAYPPAPLEPGQRRCMMGTTGRSSAGNWIEEVEGTTLDDFFASLSDPMNSPNGDALPIVNKTGITGPQTFRYEYSGRRDDLSSELKSQLGLELRPGKGPHDFLILDHVERPTPDGPIATPAARGAGPRR